MHVPGHPDEAERLLRASVAGDDLVYLRMSLESNLAPLAGPASGWTLLRDGSAGAVVAVGPVADEVLLATQGMDVAVLYAATIRPFDGAALRATLRLPDVVLVEPYLAGTSAAQATAALADRPHRLLGLGVGRDELRHYGTRQEHRAAHGLDAASLRERIAGFLGGGLAGPAGLAATRRSWCTGASAATPRKSCGAPDLLRGVGHHAEVVRGRQPALVRVEHVEPGQHLALGGLTRTLVVR